MFIGPCGFKTVQMLLWVRMEIQNNRVKNPALNICIRKEEGTPVKMTKERLYQCPYIYPMIAEE